MTKWEDHPPSKFQNLFLNVLADFPLVPLIKLERDAKGQISESTNFTILNLWLVWFGPKREDRLAIELLLMQAGCGVAGLFVRHFLALLVFRQDNR